MASGSLRSVDENYKSRTEYNIIGGYSSSTLWKLSKSIFTSVLLRSEAFIRHFSVPCHPYNQNSKLENSEDTGIYLGCEYLGSARTIYDSKSSMIANKQPLGHLDSRLNLMHSFTISIPVFWPCTRLPASSFIASSCIALVGNLHPQAHYRFI